MLVPLELKLHFVPFNLYKEKAPKFFRFAQYYNIKFESHRKGS